MVRHRTKETSIYTSVRALQSLNRRMQERSMTNTVLAASGTTNMLSRIRAVATVDPGTRQLPAPAAMEDEAQAQAAGRVGHVHSERRGQAQQIPVAIG